MSELKPCPFCGGEAHYNPYLNKVWCSNKECEGNSGSWKIAEWNTRPIEDALRAENERLKELNNDIVKYLKYFLDDAYEIRSVDPQFAGEAIIKTSVDVLAEIAEMIKDGE